MPDMIDATTWSALFLGLFAVAAALGALRKPGVWATMVGEIERSPALQLISGLLELALGIAIYLANPWVPADLLTCVMKTVGAVMVFEALAVIAFSDLYFHFWLRNLAHMMRGWVVVTLVLGLALTAAALIRV